MNVKQREAESTEERLALRIEEDMYGANRNEQLSTPRESAGNGAEAGISYVFEWYLGGSHVALYGDFNSW